MSHHARIEEVFDDPSDEDISSIVDAPNPFATSRTVFPSAIERKPPPPSTGVPRGYVPRPTPPAAAAAAAPRPPSPNTPQASFLPASQSGTFKNYQCLYPVYFDAARSRAEGRRIDKAKAIENPLAREIVEACNVMGLKTIFEPGKLHPKDWANPGRIRVELKKDGVAVNRLVQNKYVLYERVAGYLKLHPTTPSTPLKLRIPNVPFDGKPVEPPVVPRGWKLGSVLPLHSPALSGGGVTDDIFKDMMAGMGMPDMGGPSGASGQASPQIEGKKEKKKKAKR